MQGNNETMKIIVQNLAVEYLDEGLGNVILFLHGWQDDLHTFDSVTPFLSQENRVIRLDLPGFGKSEMPKEPWELNRYIKFVSDFVKKLGLDVDVIIGHSFGGRIAIKGTAEKIFQPRRIVLLGSAGTAKRKTFRNSILKIIAKIGKCITYIPPLIFWRNQLRKKIYRLIGSDYLDAGALQKTFLKIISEDLVTAAGKIIVPTLLIWGVDDTETPLSDGKKLSETIPDAELKIIKEAGHFAHKEKPEEVAELIKEFL